MPGTNAGTGQPVYFRCSNCRRTHSWVEYRTRGAGVTFRLGQINRVRLTGRKRDLSSKGNARGRNSTHSREYECEDCGHIGWSRHVDLEKKGRTLCA